MKALLIVLLLMASFTAFADSTAEKLKKTQIALSDINQSVLTVQDRTRVQYALNEIAELLKQENQAADAGQIRVVATTCECVGGSPDTHRLVQIKYLSNGEQIRTDIGTYRKPIHSLHSKCESAIESSPMCR